MKACWSNLFFFTATQWLVANFDPDTFSVMRCEFCSAGFDTRAGLSSHARAHLRDFGITNWEVTVSPIHILRELFSSRPDLVLPTAQASSSTPEEEMGPELGPLADKPVSAGQKREEVKEVPKQSSPLPWKKHSVYDQQGEWMRSFVRGTGQCKTWRVLIHNCQCQAGLGYLKRYGYHPKLSLVNFCSYSYFVGFIFLADNLSGIIHLIKESVVSENSRLCGFCGLFYSWHGCVAYLEKCLVWCPKVPQYPTYNKVFFWLGLRLCSIGHALVRRRICTGQNGCFHLSADTNNSGKIVGFVQPRVRCSASAEWWVPRNLCAVRACTENVLFVHPGNPVSLHVPLWECRESQTQQSSKIKPYETIWNYCLSGLHHWHDCWTHCDGVRFVLERSDRTLLCI